MKHIEVSPTPSELLKLREKVALRHNVDKPRVSEQKLRIISLYQKIEKVNESDPLYNLSCTNIVQQATRRMSDNKKQMRKTQAQNQKFDRFSVLVNSYIQELDSPIKKDNSEDEIRTNCYKMSILKALLSKYNSRFLEQGNYRRLINSFGLQIQPMKNLKRFRTTSGKQKSKSRMENYTEMETIIKETGKIENKTRDRERQKQKQKERRKERTIEKTYEKDGEDRSLLPPDKNDDDDFSLGLKTNFYEQAKQMYRTSTFNYKDVRFRKNNHQRKGASQTTTKRTSCPEQLKHFSKVEIEEHNFENRLIKYRQFLFMINYSNGIYRNLEIEEYLKPLKFYIGRGNNSNLIRSIMKTRFWWEESSFEEANFVWTQIKVDTIFDTQNLLIEEIEYDEVDSDSSHSRKLERSTTNTLKKGVKILEPELPELKLLTQHQYQEYLSMWKNHNAKSHFQSRLKPLKSVKIQQNPFSSDLLHNHLPRNQLLGNKKAMFYCLREYYTLTSRNVFEIVPLTFHIQNGQKDPQFKQFTQEYNRRKIQGKSNIWIIKPGEFTNRGNGISCSNKFKQIKDLISRKINKNNQRRTFILQAYLTRPLLYHRRKFDIRAYMLLTSTNGKIKGYWYQDGYVRTSSSFFDLSELDDPMIHLTNDAVQKNGECYGRFEAGNKISYNQLQRYIETINSRVDFFTMIYPEMRRIATDSIKSAAIHLDESKHQSNFELFGLDFMIDDDYKPWLIEINTNPCLQLSCGILERLIPHLVENVIRIAVDPIFPPPNNYPFTKRYNVLENALHYNKFELVYDEIRDGKQLFMLYQNSKLLESIGEVRQDQEMFDNDGDIIGPEEQIG